MWVQNLTGAKRLPPDPEVWAHENRFATTHGRIAARIKVPGGRATWPAFWMLGTDIDRVGWPACGEIDVMEHVGADLPAALLIDWIIVEGTG